MMMIMTPSNWLKDSAGQTRMESIKNPPTSLTVKRLLSKRQEGPKNSQNDLKTLMSCFQVKTLTTALVLMRKGLKEDRGL